MILSIHYSNTSEFPAQNNTDLLGLDYHTFNIRTYDKLDKGGYPRPYDTTKRIL